MHPFRTRTSLFQAETLTITAGKVSVWNTFTLTISICTSPFLAFNKYLNHSIIHKLILLCINYLGTTLGQHIFNS